MEGTARACGSAMIGPLLSGAMLSLALLLGLPPALGA